MRSMFAVAVAVIDVALEALALQRDLLDMARQICQAVVDS